MSDAVPPAEPAPSPEPGPPPAGPRLTLGRSVLLAGAGALLVLAALLLWVFREPLAARLAPPPEPVPAVDETAVLRARIADLEASLAQARQAAARQSVARGDVDPALDARVTALEAAQARVNHAAAAAVAASLVAEAAARGAPFTRELAALERLDPGARLTGELREAALTGTPSRAAVGAGFPAAAAEAAAAIRAHEGRPGAVSRALGAIGRVFTLRRIDDLSGASPDAVLARAERRALQGDLEGALAEIESLPAPGRAALGDWRAEASRRIELDRRVARLRLRALEDLAGVGPVPARTPPRTPAP